MQNDVVFRRANVYLVNAKYKGNRTKMLPEYDCSKCIL